MLHRLKMLPRRPTGKPKQKMRLGTVIARSQQALAQGLKLPILALLKVFPCLIE
jgi:hypothetical protein